MAFPTTGILDDFNRSNAGSLGANWSLLESWYGAGRLGVSGNQVIGSQDSYPFEYWNPSTFGPDCEVYVTIADTGGGSEDFYLVLRATDLGDSWDGYGMEIDKDANPDAGAIFRIDDQAWTQLGASWSQAISDGDSIGLEASGSTITAYYYKAAAAGSWADVSSGGRTDETYDSAGYLAFYGDGDEISWRQDNFGGGTVDTGTALPVLYYHYAHN